MNRKPFWCAALILFGIHLLYLVIVFMVTEESNIVVIDGKVGIIYPTSFIVIFLIRSLFLVYPGIALGVKRLHDIDISGWFLMMKLTPYIGSVVFCMRGTSGANRFGSDPLAEEAARLVFLAL